MSSSSGINVTVIIDSRRVWYWLIFLVILAICHFCLLVWLFLAVLTKNALYESVMVVLVLVLGLILGSTERRFCMVVCIVLPFLLVVLDGTVVHNTGDICAAAGATASASAGVLGVIFRVVADPIAWNATNALYEFFVVVLV